MPATGNPLKCKDICRLRIKEWKVKMAFKEYKNLFLHKSNELPDKNCQNQ